MRVFHSDENFIYRKSKDEGNEEDDVDRNVKESEIDYETNSSEQYDENGNLQRYFY